MKQERLKIDEELIILEPDNFRYKKYPNKLIQLCKRTVVQKMNETN